MGQKLKTQQHQEEYSNEAPNAEDAPMNFTFLHQRVRGGRQPNKTVAALMDQQNDISDYMSTKFSDSLIVSHTHKNNNPTPTSSTVKP